MRIMHTFSDEGASGQEERILETALWQVEHGHDVIIAAPKDNNIQSKGSLKGLRLIELPHPTAKALGDVWQSVRADVIDAHGARDASAAALADLPVPIVFTLHRHLAESDLTAHQRITWNRLDHVIVVDASIARQLIDQEVVFSRRVSVVGDSTRDFDSTMQQTVATYELARQGFSSLVTTSPQGADKIEANDAQPKPLLSNLLESLDSKIGTEDGDHSTIRTSLPFDQSMHAVLNRLIEKIKEAPIDKSPAENIYLQDVFEPALYAEILKRLPRDADFDDISHPDAVTADGRITRKLLDLSRDTIARLAPANRNFWHRMKTVLSSEELLDAIVQKFSATIEARFGKGCPRLSLIPVFYRDYPGYRISIHPDSTTKVATLQFYLPSDETQIHLGTTFHLKNGTQFQEYKTNPFKPNSAYAFARTDSSWHSVNEIGADEKIRNSLALTVFIEGQEVTAKARDMSLLRKTWHLSKRITASLRPHAGGKHTPNAALTARQPDEKIDVADSEERDYKLLFDQDWYVRQYPDVINFGEEPFKHFMNFGRKEKRDPNSLFNSHWYMAHNPDVEELGLGPLEHFIKIGAAERRAPNPLFDTEWYLRHYPEVAKSGINPLAHYVHYGVKEGKYPNPLFDTKWYLHQYPEVVASGVNPLAHYLKTGAFEGKDPNPFFDSKWYLEQYPEIAKIGINPLVHYLRRGSSDGKDPGPQFCGQLYLTQCPDIAAANINPLVHYIHHGRYESRMAHIQLQRHSDGIPYKYSANNFEAFRQARANEPYLRNRLLKTIAFAKAQVQPEVSIIVALNRQMHKLVRCLWALSKQNSSRSFEVIVVADDVNADDGHASLSQIPGLKYCRTNFVENFIAACNKGAGEAAGKYLVFLHNDCEVLPGWLDSLIDAFDEQPNSGVVCSKLLRPDGRLHDAGGRGNGDVEPDRPEYNYVRSIDSCSHSAVAMRKEVFAALGGLNAHHSCSDYLDDNLTAIVKNVGWSTVYQPFASCVWNGGPRANGQANNSSAAKSRALFLDADIPMTERDARSWNVPYLFEFLHRQGYESTFIWASLRYAGYQTQRLQKIGVACYYEPFVDSIETLLRARIEDFDVICFLHAAVFEKYGQMIIAEFPQTKIVLSYVGAPELKVLEPTS